MVRAVATETSENVMALIPGSLKSTGHSLVPADCCSRLKMRCTRIDSKRDDPKVDVGPICLRLKCR